jgi:hypothetical protein
MATTNSGGGGPGGKMICDSMPPPPCLLEFSLSTSLLLLLPLVDDHGVHGEMRNDAMNVAATALDTNPEEKDISKHIKVSVLERSLFYSHPHPDFL